MVDTDCVAQIVRGSGVDPDEALKALEDVRGEIEYLRAEGKIADLETEISRAIEKKAKYMEIMALNRQKNAINNIVKREQALKGLKALTDQGLTRPKGLMAMLLGTHKGIKGGRESVAGLRDAIHMEWLSWLVNKIETERPHLLKLLYQGDRGLLDDTVREMYALDDPMGNPATNNQDALWLGRTLATVADEARRRVNRAGAMIGRIKGWVPQNHDPIKMMKAGQMQWVQDTLPLLDLERTFRKNSDKAPEILGEIYKLIQRGKPLETAIDWESQALPGTPNIAEILSQQHRALHFLSAEHWLKYADKYGQGNVFDAIQSQLRTRARMAAAMEIMGSDPQAFFNHLLKKIDDDIWADLKLSEKEKKKQSNQLPREINTDGGGKPINMAYAIVMGHTDQPHNLNAARVMAGYRAIMSLGKMGMAVISSLNDLSTVASRMRWHGQGILSSYTQTLGRLLSGRVPEEQRQIVNLLGVGFDSILGEMHIRFMAEDNPIGSAAKYTQQFFKLSGLTWWTQRLKTAFGLMASANLAYHAKLPWAELPERLQHTLAIHGIDEQQWAAISILKKKFANGREYITPDAVHDLSDEAILSLLQPEKERRQTIYELMWKKEAEKDVPLFSKEEYLKQQWGKQLPQLKREKRQQLFDRLQGFFLDETQYGVLQADDRSRMWQTAGRKRGDFFGEVVRLMSQFKSFPIAFTQRVLGTQLYGGPGQRADWVGLAHIIAASTILGFAAMTAKDFLKGKQPRDPTKASSWLAAFLQGGGAGIYGDFLLGRFSRFGNRPLDTLAGPGIATADDFAMMAINALHGDFDAGEAIKLAMNNTPYVNLWYTRLALDYSILFHLQEMVSPGYLRRMEQRIKENYNQQYILPPSTVIKRGGGFK